MKRITTQILSIVALSLTLPGTLCASGIPVVDAAHIATNRVSHAVDYVQQVLHEANQQTQIAKQVEQITQLYEQIEQLYEQIAQMDDYLERFGDPKAILDLAGFDRSGPDTLASLVDVWLERMEQRAYSPRSLDMHRWALKSFLTWCQERDMNHPQDLTKTILESFQRWLYRYRKQNGKPLGVTTQRNRLGAVQRFFAWLCRENILDANPAADLELPRKPAKMLPKALSHDELASLFAIPDTNDVLGLRDRCILEVLYSFGLRRREVAHLDQEDVDMERGVLTVRQGKGGKSRTVPLGARAIAWLTRYREEARPKLEINPAEHALFISGYGTRLTPNYIANWVKRSMKKVGINKPGSCHLLRHTCATHMHDNGADIRFIQQLLGHARLDTTQIYTEVSINQLLEVHARTHPHGKA